MHSKNSILIKGLLPVLMLVLYTQATMAQMNATMSFPGASTMEAVCPTECANVVLTFVPDSMHTYTVNFDLLKNMTVYPLQYTGMVAGDSIVFCLSDDLGIVTVPSNVASPDTVFLPFSVFGNAIGKLAIDTILNTSNSLVPVTINTGPADTLTFDFSNQIVPVLSAVGPFCPTDMAANLPTTQNGITGNWSGDGVTGNQFDPSAITYPDTVTLTFTPDPVTQCADPNTTDVIVFAPPVLNTVEFEDCLFNLQSFDLDARSGSVNSDAYDTVKWYDGQPSIGGVQFPNPATDVDVSEIDLWVEVVDTNNCTSEAVVPVTIVYKAASVLTPDDSYSGEISPQGAARYQRHLYLLKAEEIAETNLANGDIIDAIGFTLVVAQDAPTTGDFKLYLQNSTDTLSRVDTAWTEATSITNTYSAMGLIPGDYEWQVQAVCTDSMNFSGLVNFSNADLSGCNRPINLTVNSESDDSVTLAWYAPVSPNFVHYLVEYKTVSAISWSWTTSGTLTKTLAGLQPKTNYQWRITTVCTGDASDATGSTFTTLEAIVCTAPTGLTVGTLTDTTAHVSWTSVPSSLGYVAQVRQVGTNFWFSVPSDTNNVDLALSVVPGTTFEWRVRAKCSGGGSRYTAGTNFTTTGTTVCYVPTNLLTNGITSSTATLNWAGTPGAVKYNIRYRLKNAISWANAIAPMTQVHHDSITIPAATGHYRINLSDVVQDSLIYTGNGLYVAYEYSNPTGSLSSFNSALATRQNTALKGSFGQDSIEYILSLNAPQDANAVAHGDVLTSTRWRPITHLGSRSFVDSVAVSAVYAMGSVAVPFGNPTTISALIRNYADEARTYPVTLQVKDQETNTQRYTEVVNILVPATANAVVSFSGWSPTVFGTDSIIVSIPPRAAENILANNRGTYLQVVNGAVMAQADASSSITGAGFGISAGLLLNKFGMNGCGRVNAAQVYLDQSAIDKEYYAVVMDSAGVLIDSSEAFTPDSSEINAFHAFYFPEAPQFTDEDYYVGLAQKANGTASYPVGVQWDGADARSSSFFRADIDGMNLSDTPQPGRLMIKSELIPGGPVPQITGNLALCSGDTNRLEVVSVARRYGTKVLSFSSQFASVGFSAKQALGTPNVYPAHEVNAGAWVAKGNTGREHLELEFSQPDSINFIDIYETFNPGAVDTVYVFNPGTNLYDMVYFTTAAALPDEARVLHIEFAQTLYKVTRVRIAMSTPDSLGAHSIDAVCIGKSVDPPTFASYLWSGGSTDAFLDVTAPGTYSVEVDGITSCSSSDSALVFEPSAVNPTLTADGSIPFCPGDSIELMSDRETGNTWNTGDTTQSITVNAVGDYWLVNDDGTGCGSLNSDTITVSFVSVIPVGITGNAVICPGESTTLVASPGYSSYKWNTGLTSSSITISALGLYTVTATNAAGCNTIASVTLTAAPDLTPSITGGLTICPGGSTTLDAGAGYASYFWSTGSTAQTINATAPGSYSVVVTNAAGCSGGTSATVAFYSPPIVSIGGPLTFCPNSSTLLQASGGISYLWNTTATSNTINITAPGPYSVTVTDANGCTGTGSVITSEFSEPYVQIVGDLGFCPGDMTTLDAGTGFASYVWSNGSANQTTSVGTSGEYSVRITDGNGCIGKDTVDVDEYTVQTPFIVGTLSFCGGAATQLDAGAGFASYLWSTAETTRIINVQTIGTFSVTVTDGNGCTSSASVTTTGEGTVPESPGPISGPASGVCNQTETYSISPVINAEYYVWSVPEGDTILSGQGTTSIDVMFRTASSGEIEVGAANSCGQSPSLTRRFIVVIKTPPAPGPISGPVTPVCALDVITYSIEALPGATSYQWDVPANAAVTAGQGSTIVEVTFDSNYVAGDICVYGIGICGNSPATCITTVAGLDSDGDELLDCNDNCPFSFNPDQDDTDGDGIGDACDPCDNNAGGGEACDDGDPCTTNDTFDANCDCIGTPSPDTDMDGVCDVLDACPDFDDAMDTDGDSVPDSCDVCPSGDDNIDENNNGVPDDCDTCSAFVASAGDCEAVFLGWPDGACVDLIASATGGTAPLSYSWSNGETSDVNNVCPESTTSYSVTVTDATGCTSVAEVIVEAVDVTCAPGNRVELCHYNPISGLYSPICVKKKFVQKHLDHGDQLGVCGENPCLGGGNSIFAEPEYLSMHILEPIAIMPYSSSVEKIDPVLFPNPTSGLITVKFATDHESQAEFTVYSIQGKLIAASKMDALQGINMHQFDATNIAAGVYYIRIKLGDEYELLKFVKIGN